MEVYLRTRIDGEGVALLHYERSIDDERAAVLVVDDGVLVKEVITERVGIPCPCLETHLLLASALQGEEQAVVDFLRFELTCLLRRGEFYPDADGVAIAKLYLAVDAVILIGTDIHAIDIHPETRLRSATLLTDGGYTNTIAGAIVYLEHLGG